jgi:hypothetical protein
MKNLDALCATTAREVVRLSENFPKEKGKELQNRITDSLGVLQEDGIYAFYLYLKRQKWNDLKLSDTVWPVCAELLRRDEIGKMLPAANPKESDEDLLINMTENLDHLLMAKDLLQRTLIYARYGLRAL